MAVKSGKDGAAVEIRANRYDVLSRLADDLAHEIKNPLNAIVVNLEVLRRRVANGEHDVALDRTNVIEQEIRRVHELVDQLLQLMRPPRGDATQIAVDGILEPLLTVLQVQAKAARVTLESSLDNSLYAQILPEPFKFAVVNLVTAAVDAEAIEGGRVEIMARREADGISVVVRCSNAVLETDGDAVQFTRRLLAAAGDIRCSIEREADGGTVVGMTLPPAKFS